MYRSGHARWDTGVTPPEVLALIAGDDPLPPGRALDLGCGTGTNALYLAARGWEVIGVDFSPLAISAARKKLAGRAEMRASFILADVTRLTEAGVTGSFDFVVDIGCFHGVHRSRRRSYAAEVTTLTRSGSTLLMFAFGSRLHLPGHPRAREREIRRLFTSFELVRVELGTTPLGAAWFTLRRR
ncbi:MAG: class I SAM-dependent methyltransferase [Actinomycetota bacterium]